MKRVYFKRLLVDRMGLKASERIVYSFLVYQSICDIEDVWDKETGKFDKFALLDYGDSFQLPDFYFNNKVFNYGAKIANFTGVSQPTVSRAIRKLSDIGLIDLKNHFIIHNYIYKDGFFPLVEKKELSGELLIFYSWLYYLKKDGMYIFASRRKLAKYYHVELEYVRDYIARLHKLNLVERDDFGKLIIK